MNTVEFLRGILPTKGIICITTAPHKSPKGGRDIMHHHTFSTVEQAASFAVAQSDKFDVYHANHTFDKFTTKEGPRGSYTMLERTAANAAWVRSAYVDLDVGKSAASERKYATQATSVSGLRVFCGDVSLPEPTKISSGYGIHAYWRFFEDVPSAEWFPVMEGFKRVCTHHGLLADPKVTADRARVLRPPGTKNRKNPDRILPVVGPVKLQPPMHWSDFVGIVARAVSLLPSAEVVEAVSWKPEDRPTPKDVAGECPTFSVMASEARNASEGVWWAMLQLVRHTTGGNKLAHRLSALDPRYNHDEVQGRLDRLEEGNFGPPTCAKLQALYGDASPCPTCRHFGLPNSSPVVFARRKPTEPLPDGIPPPERPYMRTKRGIEYQPAPTPDRPVPPPSQVIYPYDFYPVMIVDDALRRVKSIDWIAVVPIRGQITVTLPIEAYTNEEKMIGLLVNQGVTIDKRHAKNMGGYVSHYIKMLQASQAEQPQLSTMGWIEGTDYMEFLLGTTIISAKGTRLASISPSAANAAQGMTSKGTLEGQIEALKFYDHPEYMAQQFFLCCALGAPLMHLTGHHGSMVNLSGEPGASKSTAALAGGSFYANPRKFVQNGTAAGFTVKARLARMETLASMVLILDEITNMPPDELKALALSVSQGGRPVRLDGKGVEIPIPDSLKSTMMLTTSNNSVHAALALNNVSGAAGSMRLVEPTVKRTYVHTKTEADAFLVELDKHHGHIGPLFIRQCIVDRVNVEASMRRIQVLIDTRGKIAPAERFWSATIAVAVLACSIAYDRGWLSFDPMKLLDWALDVQLPIMRGVVADAYLTPQGVLQAFLGEVASNILVVSPQAGTPKMFVDRPPRGELVGRLEPALNTLWISQYAFRKYCDRHRLNFDGTLRQLAADGIMDRDRMSLARYVDGWASPQGGTFKIDLAHPAMTGLAPIEAADGAQIIQYRARPLAAGRTA